MKKKILLIASRPLANDGLTKIEMDIIRFSKDVIQFEIACGFGFDNEYGTELRMLGIPCFSLPRKKNVYKYMSEIKRLVEKGDYDSVYIHGNSAMMFLEAFPSKWAGARVITHCHNTKSNYPWIHYIIKPFFNMSVDEKIGCSVLASKWAYCGKRINTIVNGVDIDRFRFDKNKRGDIRGMLGWTQNVIVGHVGRFNRQKNHKKLIDIFSKMHKKDNNCRLLLIGNGELSSETEEKIKELGLKDAVNIIEHTHRPQDYMQAMDIMIMPSLFEGLCLVAVEAQANSLPVLIDDFFSPETSATCICENLNLKASDEEWARKAFEMIKNGRRDVSGQLKEKNMDHQDMMVKIQKVLINE